MFPDSIRKLKVIRLCDREEAKIMIRDGSFANMLTQYRRRYTSGKEFLPAVKAAKDAHSFHGLGLRGAKHLADSRIPLTAFQIGNDIRLLHLSNNQYELYRKTNGLWKSIRRLVSADDICQELLIDYPICKPIRERTPIKFGEF